jgi:hypothetical protein
MFSQWLWIMAKNVVPMDVNHVVLCWASRCDSRCERCASGCETRCAMLSQLWNIVKDTFFGCESLWVMLSQWLGFIVFYAEPGVSESWCVMLSQWLWIIVCYAGPGVWESGCVMLSQWLGITMWMLCQWVWITQCFSVPVGVNHGELCGGSCCESGCVILCQ